MKILSKKQIDQLDALGFKLTRFDLLDEPPYISYRLNIPHVLFKGMNIEVDAQYIHVYCSAATLRGQSGQVLLYLCKYNHAALKRIIQKLTNSN